METSTAAAKTADSLDGRRRRSYAAQIRPPTLKVGNAMKNTPTRTLRKVSATGAAPPNAVQGQGIGSNKFVPPSSNIKVMLFQNADAKPGTNASMTRFGK